MRIPPAVYYYRPPSPPSPSGGYYAPPSPPAPTRPMPQLVRDPLSGVYRLPSDTLYRELFEPPRSMSCMLVTIPPPIAKMQSGELWLRGPGGWQMQRVATESGKCPKKTLEFSAPVKPRRRKANPPRVGPQTILDTNRRMANAALDEFVRKYRAVNGCQKSAHRWRSHMVTHRRSRGHLPGCDTQGLKPATPKQSK
jgi:hypothetical protein